MDAETMAKNMRHELEMLGAEETRLRARINQLKQMAEERKRRLEALEQLEKEEAALLELLK